MTTYTHRASKIRKEDDKALLIWVANGKPYFKKHYWFRGLAPQWDKIEEWKNGDIEWDEFEEEYRLYLKGPLQSGLLDKMVSIITNENAWYDKVYLVCYEKDDTYCHRRILKDVILQKIGD